MNTVSALTCFFPSNLTRTDSFVTFLSLPASFFLSLDGGKDGVMKSQTDEGMKVSGQSFWGEAEMEGMGFGGC